MCVHIAIGGTSVRRALRGRPRRSGYSLVEVLVSMMVLAILVSIMLPALHQTMRYTAPLLRCSTNLHQLHQAISLYLGTSNDALPAGGYEALRDQTFPPLNMTLAEFGVGDIAFWVCPADSRPDVVTNRLGSVVYPPGRYMRAARRRVRIDEFGPEYPLLADRGPFHIPVQSDDSLAGPTRFVVDPLTLPMQSGFHEGHNSVWVGGRVTSRSRNASNTRR